MKEIGYKEYWALLAAYAISISSLYLLGFWGAFKINIMQYASLSDLVKLAAFPLAATFLLTFIGMIHQDLTLGANLPVGGASESRIAKTFKRYAAVISVLWMAACVLAILLIRPPYNWVAFATMFSLFATPLANQKAMLSFIPNDQLRNRLVFYALLFAGFSFSYGRTEAFKVLENPEVTVDVTLSKLDGLSKNPSDVAYLGYVGDRYFFYDRKASQIVIVIASSSPNLHLAFKKSAFLPFEW